MSDFLSIIGLIIALVAPATYLFYWRFISPRIILRFAGEQMGEPLLVPRTGVVSFAVGTKSQNQINILSTEVYFNDDQVNLFKTIGINKEISLDRNLPMSVVFPEKKRIVKGTFEGNYIYMEAKVDTFSLKLVVVSEPDHSTLPFWLSVMPTRKVRTEKAVSFKIDPNFIEDLKKQGLLLKPGEAIHVSGVQSQESVFMVSSKGTSAVDVREVVDEP